MTSRTEPETLSFLAPLRYRHYRRIWTASVMSNLGQTVQAVGAAWTMTQLTSSADLVALVQAAAMLPLMLIALPAGAIADMYDRRRVAMSALALAFTAAAGLAAVTYLGLLTPWVLLGFCFLIGGGMALYTPSWAASASEQVPDEVLPSAVALNSISFNIARSFGPALGGLLVAAAGAAATFVANAALYLPLLVALSLWKRKVEPPRLPPEQLGRAVVSGVRYFIHTPPVRVVALRGMLTSFFVAAIYALLPLIARDLLKGGAGTYGVLLGCFGMGAVGGALSVAHLRRLGDDERSIRVATAIMGAAVLVLALSRVVAITSAAMMAAGAMWMVITTSFNIGMQFSAPRWVTGRALAGFQASIAAGMAAGAWAWGAVADIHSVPIALLCASAGLLLTPFAGRWLPMPTVSGPNTLAAEPAEPDVRLAVTARSGPVVIEILYEVELSEARAFYTAMQELQRVRRRNGGHDWSLARDIAEPRLWTERFYCPTWLDYLRMRARMTETERECQQRVYAFHAGPDPIRVTRKLERPFGSVRWREDSPTPSAEILPITPSAT